MKQLRKRRRSTPRREKAIADAILAILWHCRELDSDCDLRRSNVRAAVLFHSPRDILGGLHAHVRDLARDARDLAAMLDEGRQSAKRRQQVRP